MSARVTEAHRELAYAILFATEDGHAGPNETAQLIADSEAKACDQLRAEVAWWKNWHDENEKMEDGIAVKVQATIDGLRAEVERLKNQRDNLLKPMREQAIARAERAEAELAAERARLADLVADLNDACITLESAENDCDDYAMQNTAFKLNAVRAVLLQYIPNAAMKEGGK